MIRFPNAKINLGLYVERRRDDGYHDISTVFYPIPLKDVVEVVKSESTVLRTYGNPVDCPPEKNLVMKAYRLLELEFGLPPVEICLYKHIPDGAGLGGGSSDASAVLKILNDLFALGLDDAELARRAVKLGADCPFFVYNRPVAARGIGDVFEDVDVDLSGMTAVVVKPDVYVSTAEAYRGVPPRIPEMDVAEIVRHPVGEWKGVLENDFEAHVFGLYPRLQEIKQSLYDSGAVYASMSGSGSAIYGLFGSDIMAETFVSRSRKKGYSRWCCRLAL